MTGKNDDLLRMGRQDMIEEVKRLRDAAASLAEEINDLIQQRDMWKRIARSSEPMPGLGP